MEAFTRDNREAIYRVARLRIRHYPVEREVDLAVSLAAGVGLLSVSERGSGTGIHAPYPSIDPSGDDSNAQGGRR